MIFPKYLTGNNIIGVTAPSAGVTKECDHFRFHNGCTKLKEKGYSVTFTDNVFKSDEYGRSSDKETRAREFMSLINDTTIDYIVSAKGGDYLAEMLPYIDFEAIKKNPKWVQGYSDNTSILFAITTLCDIATVYGDHFGNYGMNTWHKSVADNIAILEGKLKSQSSFDMYENDFGDNTNGFNLTEKVVVKNGRGNTCESFEGRLIGGCLDVLFDIAGTKYENVTGFAKKYANDGIIWYMESFDAIGERIIIMLWKLKELGWFENVKGFIFGRPCFYKSFADLSYSDAVMTALEEFHVPVIFDADIGHKAPQWTMINGAKARIEYADHKATLTYID